MKVKLFAADVKTGLSVDYAEGGVRAGFPSPAQDYETESIDLNKELIRHPATTFYARAKGDSMRDCGIDDGDLLIVDKALEPQDGNIVVTGSSRSNAFASTRPATACGSSRPTTTILPCVSRPRTILSCGAWLPTTSSGSADFSASPVFLYRLFFTPFIYPFV